MSGKRQIFKLSTLKKLLNEENSCVSLVSCTRLLAIPPYYLNDMKGGVIFSLNKLLKKYDPSLNGIIVGYQNLTILWNEDSGKIRMGAFEAELDVRVEFYVFQPRIGNYLEGLINKKSNNHIGCLVHHCFNATILRPEDITFEDWICKNYNINDKVIFKVKDLDFTGSVPYIEGDIDDSLFHQCRPNFNNLNCDLNNSTMISEEIKTEISQNPNVQSENISSPSKHKERKKEKKRKNVSNEETSITQVNQSNALPSLGALEGHSKSALDINVNRQINEIISSQLKMNESIKENNFAGITEEPVKIKTQKKSKKNQDEGNEENKVKKKKEKKSKKKDKEGSEIQIEDVNALTEAKCVDGLHDDGLKKEGFDSESSKSKKKKKKKKDEPSSQSESPKKTTEATPIIEEPDNVFYSTQLDPSKKSEKLNITFCSPILPEPVSGNKKRKKEKEKRQEVLEYLALMKKEDPSTKDKKPKSLKRKREGGSESEGLSTPKKYKNGNMYDVVYSPSPKKSYIEEKSLFSDSEKSVKGSPLKEEVKLNGDIHDVLENCDGGKDEHKPTVQSLLDEIKKEVIERFQSESEIQNGGSCEGGKKEKGSKTVKVGSKEEKRTKKKKKKKEKEKEKKKKGSKETGVTENTTTSLYEKLLQDAMLSINLINEEVSSSSFASKALKGKEQRRKKGTKDSIQT